MDVVANSQNIHPQTEMITLYYDIIVGNWMPWTIKGINTDKNEKGNGFQYTYRNCRSMIHYRDMNMLQEHGQTSRRNAFSWVPFMHLSMGGKPETRDVSIETVHSTENRQLSVRL